MFKGVTGSSSVVSISTSSSELSSFWDTEVSDGCSWVTDSTIGGPRITGRKADWCNDGFTVGISGSVGLEPLIGGGRGPWRKEKCYVTQCVMLALWRILIITLIENTTIRNISDKSIWISLWEKDICGWKAFDLSLME